MKSLLSARPGGLQKPPPRPPADSRVPTVGHRGRGLINWVSSVLCWTPLHLSPPPPTPPLLWCWATSWLCVIHLLGRASNCFGIPLSLFPSFINVIDSVSHVRSLPPPPPTTPPHLWFPSKLSLSLFDSFHLCLTRTPPECNEEKDRWREWIERWETLP